MADYNNTRDSSLPDPASPGFRDGDTITLQNGSKFSRQSGRWEPVRFQTVGQQSKEVPVTAIPSETGVVFTKTTQLTQAQYDELAVKDAAVMYVIVG